MAVDLDRLGEIRFRTVPALFVQSPRDRFADVVMTARAHECVPQIDRSDLAQTMRLVADAAMGIMVGQLTRTAPVPRDLFVQGLANAGWAIICDRHPEVAGPP